MNKYHVTYLHLSLPTKQLVVRADSIYDAAQDARNEHFLNQDYEIASIIYMEGKFDKELQVAA